MTKDPRHLALEPILQTQDGFDLVARELFRAAAPRYGMVYQALAEQGASALQAIRELIDAASAIVLRWGDDDVGDAVAACESILRASFGLVDEEDAIESEIDL